MSSPDDPLVWARDHTPVLASFQEEYGDSQPLSGYTIAFASHLESKSGVAIETLHTAGADVVFAPSEPQSTHGDVVEALDERPYERLPGIVVSQSRQSISNCTSFPGVSVTAAVSMQPRGQ